MLPTKGNPKDVLVRTGCRLLIALMLLSFVPLASPGAQAAQDVTLTFTCTTTKAYLNEDFGLRVEASAPITGTVRLYWTINGAGPYVFSQPMTNGVAERDFAAQLTGNWTIWFVWEGNEQYDAATSNSITVEIVPGSPPDDNTLMIVIAVLLVVVVAVAAVYYLRSKRKR